MAVIDDQTKMMRKVEENDIDTYASMARQKASSGNK
jgi:hypothetical protein